MAYYKKMKWFRFLIALASAIFDVDLRCLLNRWRKKSGIPDADGIFLVFVTHYSPYGNDGKQKVLQISCGQENVSLLAV